MLIRQINQNLKESVNWKKVDEYLQSNNEFFLI